MGGEAMELIAANLFVIITMVGTIVFEGIFANLHDTPFEGAFSFVREKIRRRELALGLKIIAGITLISVLVYELGIYVIRMHGCQVHHVAVWEMILPILVMLSTFFSMSGGVVRGDLKAVMAGTMILFALPFTIAILILVKSVQLDLYCGYASVIMVFLVLWAAYEYKKSWREGDM